jgi:hypothetical protein
VFFQTSEVRENLLTNFTFSASRPFFLGYVCSPGSKKLLMISGAISPYLLVEFQLIILLKTLFTNITDMHFNIIVLLLMCS